MSIPEELDLKDVRAIDRLMRQPDWKMPAGLHEKLPALLLGFIAKHQAEFVNGEKNRDVIRAIRELREMDRANKSREAPPAQEVNVHVDRDVVDAIGDLDDLPDEELEALAAVAPILERLERMRGDEQN